MEFDIHTTSGKLADLRRRNEQAKQPASEAAVAKVHDKGKMTARERVLALLDPDSFTELDEFADTAPPPSAWTPSGPTPTV